MRLKWYQSDDYCVPKDNQITGCYRKLE